MSRTAHPFRRLTSRLAVGRALPFVLLAALVAAPAAAKIYTYESKTGGNIPYVAPVTPGSSTGTSAASADIQTLPLSVEPTSFSGR